MHDKLIEIGNLLFQKQSTFLNHGYIIRWIEACLVDDLTTFDQREHRIRRLDGKRFIPALLEMLHRLKHKMELTDEDAAVLDIRCFYDSLYLFEKPHRFSRLFDQRLNPTDYHAISSIASSDAVLSQGGLRELGWFYNNFTRHETNKLFKKLQILMDQSASNLSVFAFKLKWNHQAIGVAYQIGMQRWLCKDPNAEHHQTTLLTKEQLVDKIFINLDQNDSVVMMMALFSTAQQSLRIKKEFLHHFAQFKPSPHSLPLQMSRPNLGELMHQALRYDDLKILEQLLAMGALNVISNNHFYALLDDSIRSGLLRIVRLLVRNTSHANLKYTNNMTPLLIAVEAKQFEIAKFLIDSGAELNSQNDAPVHLVWTNLIQGNLNFLNYLIAKGLKVSSCIKSDLSIFESQPQTRTAAMMVKFFMAIEDGDVTAFLSTYTPLAFPFINYAETALCIAVRQGRHEIASYLLKNNPTIYQGLFCQHFMQHFEFCQKQYIELLENLFAAGLSVNADLSENDTFLHHAALLGCRDIVKFLLSKHPNINAINNHGCTPLITAMQSLYYDIAQLLIEHGADVNLVQPGMMLPICMAAHSRSFSMIELLIKFGAKLDTLLTHNQSALCVAIQRNDTDCMRFLIRHGANIHELTRDGSSVLMGAVSCGHILAVKTLLQHGAQINAKRNDGLTALIIAACKGDTDMLRCLIKHGADVNAKLNQTGHSALSIATTSANHAMISALLDAGANINTADHEGVTPLSIATHYGRYHLMQSLIKRGADVNAITKDGQTILMIALLSEHFNIVRLLLDNSDLRLRFVLNYATLLRLLKNTPTATTQKLITRAIPEGFRTLDNPSKIFAFSPIELSFLILRNKAIYTILSRYTINICNPYPRTSHLAFFKNIKNHAQQPELKEKERLLLEMH